MDEIENSKTWEEEIYWNHFHSVHFSRILPPTFHHHLTLPKKFIAYEITKLPENAILKGPNGMISDVKLKKDDSNHVMLSGDGWKDFVKAYALVKNDLLIFKYDRINNLLEVFIFDQTSLCERESSYFVKKRGQSQSDGATTDGQVKSRSDEHAVCSSDRTADDPDDSDKSDEDGRDKRRTSIIKDKFASQQHNSLKKNGKTTWRKARHHSIANDHQGKEVLSCKQHSKKRKSSTVFSVARACYRSNRRPITEAEKNEAYAKACRSATDESFIAIMRPSHVYRRFSLVIPRQWNPKDFCRNTSQECCDLGK